MKKLFIFLSMLIPMSFALAQSSITVKFTAVNTSGNYCPFNTVEVSNMTQNWGQSLTYPDTTLVLTYIDGVGEFQADGHLSQNFPNPFYGSTEVRFDLAEAGQTDIQVIDMKGSVITQSSTWLSEGEHRINVSLEEPQLVLLRVATAKSSHVIKMLNIGQGTSNNVEVSTLKKEVVRNTKAEGNGTFALGDTMSYSGIAIRDGGTFSSLVVIQPQNDSEVITLVFDIDETTIPTVTTNDASGISYTSAVCGGNVTNDGGLSVTVRGVCWSTSPNPTTDNAHTTDGSGTGSFTSNITGLTEGTAYYVRAYAINSKGTAYGEQKTFATSVVNGATVTTSNVSSITTNSAICGGNVTNDGGATVTARGVCWSTNQNPTINDSHTNDGTGTGSFTSNITGLSAGTVYYVRAYATNSAGTSYGEQKTFTTLADMPTITTNNVSNIASTTATCGGNVTNNGGATVTARGVCYGPYPNTLIISNDHTTDGSGTGSFTSSITGLSPGNTYYVRAYATNSVGTAYGETKTFTTPATTPTVTTNDVSNIATTAATCGGNVTATGGATVTERGICWSTSQNPTISGSHTANGSGTGSFTCYMTGLTQGTTYYVRAYATNSAGTSYGETKTFITLSLPTVTSNFMSSVTMTTATSGGNVTDEGSAPVTARGVCWSTSSNPTVNDSHTSDGTGTGSFTSTMTGLTPGTWYYMRAYATNSLGTSYGDERWFQTDPATVPTVTTGAVQNIKPTSAKCLGNATNENGATITAKGFCWSTSQNPTVSDSHTTEGSDTGGFSSVITDLTPNTTYYVRAYATNSAGTGYGVQRSFTTKSVPTGSINGLFTVSSANKKVYFSKGNLQYKASTGTWQFASSQYTIIGSNNSNISSSYSGWIDLFGWGTGSNPTNTSTSNSSYSSFTDWGSNAISNGGNTADLWRTLTYTEWDYLLVGRTTASGWHYAKATVNGVKGLILLPDDWSTSYYTLYNPDTYSVGFTVNTITTSTWTNTLEAHGAVFLPIANYRSGTTYNNSGIGLYWSATQYGSTQAYFTRFYESMVEYYVTDRYYGYSVRLVSDAN